jgi:parallel beta-helix repeat protein
MNPAHCDRVASTHGSDRAPGTARRPVRGVDRLIHLLKPGQTGCLRSGNYARDDQIRLSTRRITLTSYPGDRATIQGRVWLDRRADGAVVSRLDLDGRNSRGLPSPTINADRALLRGDDITNEHTGICVSVGNLGRYGRARGARIIGNSIHDCGRLPATNFDHGIYVAAADGTVIRDNRIYDNADRGIQLFPDAQGTRVTGNLIYANGEGVIFGGDESHASSGNLVARNVITNSRVRDNVESHWEGRPGTGNVLRDNCIGGGAYDDGDMGIQHPAIGFSRLRNREPVGTGADCEAG